MTAPDLTPTLTESQKINLNIISMNTRVNEHDTDIARLNKLVIFGNGELPLVEQVRNLNAFVDTMKFWQRAVALALLGQTVTFGVAALVYFVKLYPLLSQIAAQSKP